MIYQYLQETVIHVTSVNINTVTQMVIKDHLMCTDTERDVNISIITAWHSFKHKKKKKKTTLPIMGHYISNICLS